MTRIDAGSVRNVAGTDAFMPMFSEVTHKVPFPGARLDELGFRGKVGEQREYSLVWRGIKVPFPPFKIGSFAHQ